MHRLTLGFRACSKSSADARSEGLTIAEAARRTGVSAHTLRYYERAGLVVTTVDRTSGGRRRYRQLDLRVDPGLHQAARHRHADQDDPPLRRAGRRRAAATSPNGWRCWRRTAPRCWPSWPSCRRTCELIDHKIGVYRGRLEAGDADGLWAPNRPVDDG